MSKKVLIFDITGEYGHFKKYNTTTSPLTYAIPPRTAIVGIIGAILGIPRELSPGKFPIEPPLHERFSKENADVAVQIIKPVKRVNVAFNLINTKEHFFDLSKAGHSQINFELLKDPHYRIFVSLKDLETYDQLKKRLKNKQFVYTPYLGLAQFIANIEFVAEEIFELRQGNNEFTEIISAVNMRLLQDDEEPINFDYQSYYIVNNMPIEMNRNREVLEYSDVLIEQNGKPLVVKIKHYYQSPKFGNIVFL